jgi:virulence-associated protein VapD
MESAAIKHPEHATGEVTSTEDEYDSLVSTIEVLKDHELLEQLKKSKKDIKEGRVSDWDDFMKERGVE